MRRYALLVFGLSLVAIGQGGCNSTSPPTDLGTTVFETPKVDGADEPYPLPRLGPPVEESDDPLAFP